MADHLKSKRHSKSERHRPSEIRTFEYQIHSKTEHFEGLFTNGQPFENGPFKIRTMASLDRFI